MYNVPLYFQLTQSSSPSVAGIYLVPSVVGNTVGGLASGAYIGRYGRYKRPTLAAAVISSLCHTLLTIRWTGHTSIIESLYIFPGGVGTGIAHSSTFVAIGAGTNEEELAIAGGGLYLCGNFGSLLGVTLASSLLRVVFGHVASSRLIDEPNKDIIIDKSLSDIEFVQRLTGKIKSAVVGSYVVGFRASFRM
jgi:MFS family permease